MERAIGLLEGRWRKLLYVDHLDVRFIAKVVMAACLLHNIYLLRDDFDESYFFNQSITHSFNQSINKQTNKKIVIGKKSGIQRDGEVEIILTL